MKLLPCKIFCLFIFVCVVSLFTGSLQATTSIPKIKSGDPLPADIFIKIAKIINPTVVNISTTTNLKNNFPFSDFNDPYFFFKPPSQAQPLQSLGTGFIIASKGLILTNTHVINKADIVQVQLKDDSKFYTAKVIGKDEFTDVALIQIDAKKTLPFVNLGDSAKLQVGEWVTAVGNPYGHGHTITKGIISALNREIDDLNLFPFLQTDTLIHPGNSGGPLVNTSGEVIGINTAIRTHGISFAIPIDNVKAVLNDLQKHGRVRRGFIGVQMTQYKNNKGALILGVMPNTPAEKAGIKAQDVIVRFNKRKVKNERDLFKAVASTPVNKKTPVELIRKGKAVAIDIIPIERTQSETTAQTSRLRKNEKQLKLGATMVQGTKETLKSLGLPPLNRVHPVVTKVNPGSPAAFAGLQKKDVILKVNGWKVHSTKEVQKRLMPNQNNTINLLRYRSHQYINITIRFSGTWKNR